MSGSSPGGSVVISVTSHTTKWLKPEEGTALVSRNHGTGQPTPAGPHDDDDDGLVINQVGVTPGVILRVMASQILFLSLSLSLSLSLRGCKSPTTPFGLPLLAHFQANVFVGCFFCLLADC